MICGTNASNSTITGGQSNTVCGCYAFIGGGCNNTVTHNGASVIGSGVTSVCGDTLHINCLHIGSCLPTSDPSVAGIVWRDGTDLKISVG